MNPIKTMTGALAIVGLTILGATTVVASDDLDDAMRDLDDARAEQARAEADLRAVQAQRAATLARESAREAQFARFEAESRAAAERPTKVYEYKRIGPTGTRYIERHEYAPIGGGSYVEHYESW